MKKKTLNTILVIIVFALFINLGIKYINSVANKVAEEKIKQAQVEQEEKAAKEAAGRRKVQSVTGPFRVKIN